MPRIFDNLEQALLPALRETIQVADQVADQADFCVGYFNLKQLDSHIRNMVWRRRSLLQTSRRHAKATARRTTGRSEPDQL